VPHKILLGGFNAKLVREVIFKPTIGNGSLYEDNNGTGNGNGSNVFHTKKSSF
jgi:hypothetical protein